MKIKAEDFLTPLFCFYLVTSVHVVAETPSVNSFIRLFRLATIPFLLFTIVALLPRQTMQK
ncbi:MAG: hypothetical protein HC800_04165 [Phormidesmis sp. RL_2_1]|nr:hypothetical protein [Phormidesmis sp. RL_2_1]